MTEGMQAKMGTLGTKPGGNGTRDKVVPAVDDWMTVWMVEDIGGVCPMYLAVHTREGVAAFNFVADFREALWFGRQKDGQNIISMMEDMGLKMAWDKLRVREHMVG